jgi:hypothetical protein
VATGETMIAMIVAQEARLKAALYRTSRNTYRIRIGGGIGWVPEEWHDYNRAMSKLLGMQTYGQRERQMLVNMCKES